MKSSMVKIISSMQESVVDLSRAHENSGDYKNQLECIQRALPIYEKQYGKDHIRVCNNPS